MLVRLADDTQLEQLDDWLWSHGHGSFVPHGTAKDQFPEKQPIYLTCNMEIPNQAKVLFLLNITNHPVADFQNFQEIRILFDQSQPQPSRDFWAECVRAGHNPQMVT